MSNKRSIQEMKEKYQRIEIPETLKEMVEDTIEKAKEEKKIKKTKGKWMASLGGFAAAVFFVMIVNTNQAAAQIIGKIPVVGLIVKVITMEDYNRISEDGNRKAEISIPEVHIDSEGNIDYHAAESNVNEEIRNYVNQIIENYEKDIEEGMGYESVYSSYHVAADSERLFSIRIDTEIVMAGTNRFSKIYHIDKKSGKMISLPDLFVEGSDYVAIISEEIKRQMEEQMSENETVSYFYNTEYPDLNFKCIKSDQNFYINEEGHLVLVFDKYEIAPGYMGIVEFTIPGEAIQDIVREGYIKNR